MTKQHPITPPPELVQQWVGQFAAKPPCMPEQIYIATLAAQWGADQELEACCEWLVKQGWFSADEHEAIEELRADRRPKPPSLKAEALEQLDSVQGLLEMKGLRSNAIRRALEALDD